MQFVVGPDHELAIGAMGVAVSAAHHVILGQPRDVHLLNAEHGKEGLGQRPVHGRVIAGVEHGE